MNIGTNLTTGLGTVLGTAAAIFAVAYMMLWHKLPEYAKQRRGTKPLQILWYSSKVITGFAAIGLAGFTGYPHPDWSMLRLMVSVAMLWNMIASLSRLLYELWQTSLTEHFIANVTSELAREKTRPLAKQ